MCIIYCNFYKTLHSWNFFSSTTLLNNTDSIVAIYHKKDSPCRGQLACRAWLVIRDFRINAPSEACGCYRLYIRWKLNFRYDELCISATFHREIRPIKHDARVL